MEKPLELALGETYAPGMDEAQEATHFLPEVSATADECHIPLTSSVAARLKRSAVVLEFLPEPRPRLP